jgi:hypothetical protein
LCHVPAVSYWKKNERVAKNIISKMFSNYHFRDVGLVINPLFPYLGASPDGFLYGEQAIILEVKHVFNESKLSLSDLCKRPNFCLDFINGAYMFT